MHEFFFFFFKKFLFASSMFFLLLLLQQKELSPNKKKNFCRIIKISSSKKIHHRTRAKTLERGRRRQRRRSSECFDLEETEVTDHRSKRNTEPTRSRSSTARSWTKGTKSSYHRARWTDCRNSETWISRCCSTLKTSRRKQKRTVGF